MKNKKLARFAAFTLLAPIFLLRAAFAQEASPDPIWVTEKLPVIQKLGVDPSTDLRSKGNYHYSYLTKKEVSASGYTCPVGAVVDISKRIVLIRTSKANPCLDKKQVGFSMLKIENDGSLTPFK